MVPIPGIFDSIERGKMKIVMGYLLVFMVACGVSAATGGIMSSTIDKSQVTGGSSGTGIEGASGTVAPDQADGDSPTPVPTFDLDDPSMDDFRCKKDGQPLQWVTLAKTDPSTGVTTTTTYPEGYVLEMYGERAGGWLCPKHMQALIDLIPE